MNQTGQTPIDDTGGGGSSGGSLASLASLLSSVSSSTPAMPLTSLIKRSLSAYREDNQDDGIGIGDDDQSTSMSGGGGGGGFGLMTTSTLASIDNDKLIATTTNSINNNHQDTSQQLEQSFGDWWNEYWSRQPFPSGYTQSSITLLACFITTLIFFIVVGNLLVCIAIFTEKSLKPTQNWFIASLALSDMLYGLSVMPFSLARELMGFWIFGPLWCEIHEALDVLLATASINTLCLISLDRYWSITQAVNYLKKRTPRRSALMIAFVWVFSAAVSLPPLFGWKKQTPSSGSSSNSANGIGSTTTTTKPDNIQLNTSTRRTTQVDQNLLEPATSEDERFAGSGQDTPTRSPADGQLDENVRARRQTRSRPARASPRSTEIPPRPSSQQSNQNQRLNSSSSSQSTPATSTTAASSSRPDNEHPNDDDDDDHQLDNLISSEHHSIHRQHRRDQPKQKHSINRQQQQQQQQQPKQTTKYAISPQSRSPSSMFYLNNDDSGGAYYGDDDRSPSLSLSTNNYQPVNGIVQSLFMQSEQVLSAAGQQQLINAPPPPPPSPLTPPVVEYPQCQLSDDVGYVVYSALGSFFIPCGVMVFTYIKIFMAARSRARRAINKQSRAQAAAEKANRRLAAAANAAAQQRRTLTGGGGQLELGAKSDSSGPLGSATDAVPTTGSQLRANLESRKPKAGGDKHEMMKGRLVMVERRRSTITPTAGLKAAAGAVANKTDACQITSEQQQVAIGEPFTITTSGAKQASASALNGTVTSNDSSMITVMSASMAELPVTRFNFKQQDEASQQHRRQPSGGDGARKAAALLKAISQVEASNADDLQHELIGEVSSQPDDAAPDNGKEASKEKESSDNGVPEIVVDERRSATSGGSQSVAEQDTEQHQHPKEPQPVEAVAGSNSTNETCFMTIEEDSDNLDAQAGRTIMMIACNAKQSNQLVGAKSQGMMMTMMPPQQQSTTASGTTATSGANPSNSILCNNVACLRQRAAGGGPGTARSGSSYCGSSMTINDDDDDDDDEEEEEEDDDDDDDDGEEEVDDEDLLTDDCNGYSGSCGLDQYCPATTTSSSCAQCRECVAADQELSLKQRQQQHLNNQSVGSSPRSINDKLAAVHRHHHLKHRQTNAAAAAADETCDGAQSLTADDNLSLTEYRSDDEDEDDDEEVDDDQNSSIVGHDVLDATERVYSGDKARRKSQAAPPVTPTPVAASDQQQQQQQSTPIPPNNLVRKKSSIGQRLARLGSSVPPLGNQSGGLLALAASQHQQTSAAAGMTPASGLCTIANTTTATTTPTTQTTQTTQTTTRNLKALRQNFFHKLNQLTAKSAAKQNKIRSPIRGAAGKSSSGSSYEPSLDYATTSNVHSMMENYHQETTFGETDDYEQRTSDETTKDQPSGDQQDQRLITTGSTTSNKPNHEPSRSSANKKVTGKSDRSRGCNGDNDNDNDDDDDDDDELDVDLDDEEDDDEDEEDEYAGRRSSSQKKSNKSHESAAVVGKKDSHRRLSHGFGLNRSKVDGQTGGAANIRHLKDNNSSLSTTTTGGNTGGSKALRLDLGGTLKGDRERHHNNHQNHHNHHNHHHHHQPPARIGPSGHLANFGSGKKSLGSGTNALMNDKLMDRSLTVMTVGSEGTTGSERTAGGRLAGNGSGGGQGQGLGQSQTNGNSRAYLASDNERHKRKLAKARERRATLILGLIMAAFICSWLPFFTFYVLRALCHVCREYISPRFEAFIFWLGYCNSAINPIIYTIFNRDFRKAFRKILFKCL